MNQLRDGHMQMAVPKGRANYEPNSLAKAREPAGAREDPANGSITYPSEEQGQKLRIRPESFADHYSQARLYFRSMDPAEQAHIRLVMVADLRNVDEDLASRVARCGWLGSEGRRGQSPRGHRCACLAAWSHV